MIFMSVGDIMSCRVELKLCSLRCRQEGVTIVDFRVNERSSNSGGSKLINSVEHTVKTWLINSRVVQITDFIKDNNQIAILRFQWAILARLQGRTKAYRVPLLAIWSQVSSIVLRGWLPVFISGVVAWSLHDSRTDALIITQNGIRETNTKMCSGKTRFKVFYLRTPRF